jgi:hypothetical protein
MAKNRTVRVTPNLLLCLDELRAALKALPAGDLKARGRRALAYLERTFAGERQPQSKGLCPPDTSIIK